MGVSVINQSIKFFTIFLLAFNVFAGGDDRDEEYYENLDEEEKALREETAKTTESLELLNEEINRMGKVRTAHMNLMTLKMSVEQLGNALQSANLEGQIQAYHRELDKGHDKNDEVIEATSANLFYWLDNKLHTPELGFSGVNGLIRQRIIKHDDDIVVKKTTLADLKKSKSMFY